MQCLFSIIIPTYNRALFLPHAIASILTQTYTHWELLIVDDGSTDNTRDVVEQYQDSRIKYIYQTNAERSIARNNGIKHAVGDYICFLDSDDTYASQYLEHLHDLLIKNNKDRACFVVSAMQVQHNGRMQVSVPRPIQDNKFDYFFRESVPPSTVCLSASLLKKHCFDARVVISEDTKLWVEIMRENPFIIINASPDIHFLFHDDNTINISKRNVYQERKSTLQLILTEDKEYNFINKRNAYKVINDCNFGISRYYTANNRHFKAMWIQLLSILQMPFYRTKDKLFIIKCEFMKIFQ